MGHLAYREMSLSVSAVAIVNVLAKITRTVKSFSTVTSVREGEIGKKKAEDSEVKLLVYFW